MKEYHVNVVLGTLPPLLPTSIGQTKKFSSLKEAMKWTKKFNSFLKKQKRTYKYIEPTKAEIKFHGGNHIGLSFESITKVISEEII